MKMQSEDKSPTEEFRSADYTPSRSEVERAWAMRQFQLDQEAGRETDGLTYSREFRRWWYQEKDELRTEVQKEAAEAQAELEQRLSGLTQVAEELRSILETALFSTDHISGSIRLLNSAQLKALIDGISEIDEEDGAPLGVLQVEELLGRAVNGFRK